MPSMSVPASTVIWTDAVCQCGAMRAPSGYRNRAANSPCVAGSPTRSIRVDPGMRPGVHAVKPRGSIGPPNGWRLSCRALKKDSFLNLRAPPASSACLGSNPIRLQDYVEGQRRAHVSKVMLFGWIPAGVPLPEKMCLLTRCEPRLARARGRLDQHAEVKNVRELRSRIICAVEQNDTFRGTLGRSRLQGIGAVTARTSQKVEGIPTRYAPSPHWLDRFAFQPAPVNAIRRPFALACGDPIPRWSRSPQRN